jgi:arginyl-tRNA synthetase
MKELIAKLLAKHLGKKEQEILNLIGISPAGMGDYAFPCFSLAKEMKKSPVKIAEEIEEKIKLPKEISKIQVNQAYLNFFISPSFLIQQTIKKILKEKAKYGKGKEKSKVMIEFSQPNTHKAFHVGHIRNTSIGESLSRLYEFQGNKVIRANYSGDTGMHIAKWIWCYKTFHNEEDLVDDEEWIASIYVDAVKRLEENPDFQLEVDAINRLLETREDKEINQLWDKTRKLSIESWKKIYKELNTRFDKYYFESEVEKRGKEIAQNLVKQKIAIISDGATIMDLQKYNFGVWVLLRKDGTVLYSAKDLALAEKKFKDYEIDKSIYLVADEQQLHFQQLMKTLELMNFKELKKCQPVHYGLVRLPTGKMSSRTGQNILYSEFMEDVMGYAKEEIKKRFPQLNNKELEERALKISIASIKYAMLKQGPNKVIVFVREDALDFEGNTGPYLQYSYARASSIMKKSKKSPKLNQEAIDEQEVVLVKKLGMFPEIASHSYSQLNPSLLANYSYELAQIFNEFYHSSKVIDDDREEFRLALVESFRIVLKSCLNLLGIDVIEEM